MWQLQIGSAQYKLCGEKGGYVFQRCGLYPSSLCHMTMAFSGLNIIQFEQEVVVGCLHFSPNFKAMQMNPGDIPSS